MSYTNGLDKPTDYFNTVLYTGNATARSITGVGFQPDFLWIKDRDDGQNHGLRDVIRGATKRLVSNSTNAENTQTQGVSSFDSNGFSLGTGTDVNKSGDKYVSWNWLASNTTASNTDGSITSSVSANTTAGFSIVTYTGTGAVGNIGHGLGATPKVVIKKKRSGADAWNVWHESIGDGSKALYLNTTNAIDTNANYASNVPTSSLFYVGTDSQINASGGTYVAYCFAEKKGFSKFGSYTGNGNADGTFVYTGFKPAFVITKVSSGSTVQGWLIRDNKRDPFNVSDTMLPANLSSADVNDASAYGVDLLSNGFKIRGTDGGVNQNGGTLIYMAFAESPFVTSSGIPTTAR